MLPHTELSTAMEKIIPSWLHTDKKHFSHPSKAEGTTNSSETAFKSFYGI